MGSDENSVKMSYKCSRFRNDPVAENLWGSVNRFTKAYCHLNTEKSWEIVLYFAKSFENDA